MAGAVTVGRLIIDMAADVAQLKSDMSTATAVVESAGAAIERAATAAKTALIGLAAAFGPAAFVEMIGATIEATAQLDLMSQKTGASVEALSGLRAVAKLTGTDMESVAQGIGKLDKAMLDAATTGGKTKSAFDAIGVAFKDTAGNLRNVDDVMLDVAVKFSGMQSSAEKTALAQILLGKAGKELIPVLNELGAAGEYQTKVTAEQAAIAEDFEKTLVRLGAGGREMKQIFASEITPALDILAKTLLDVLNQGDGLFSGIKTWMQEGGLAVWALDAAHQMAILADAILDEINVLHLMGEEVALVVVGFLDFGKTMVGVAQIMSGDVKGGFATVRSAWDDVTKSFEQVKKDFNEPLSTKFQDAFVSAIVSVQELSLEEKKAAPVLDDFTKAVKAHTDARDALQLTLDKQLASLNAQVASLELYGQKTQETTADVVLADIAAGKFLTTLKDGTKVWDADAEAREKAALATAQQIDQDKTLIKVLEDSIAATKRYYDGLSAGLLTLQTTLKAETDRNDQFGLTTSQIMNLTIAEEAHRLELMRTEEATYLEIAAEERRLGLLQALQAQFARGESIQAWSNALNAASQGVANFLADFVEHGSSAFKNLWDNFKTWALQALAEIAAKEIVISIVGTLGIGGSVGASAASGLANSVGGGPGNLLSTVLGGGGSSTSLLGGTFGTAATAGFSAGLDTLGIAMADGAAAVGGFASVMGAGLAVAGPIAAAALAGYFIYKAVAQKPGGPMTRDFGTSGADISTFGDFSSYHKLVGTDAVNDPTLGSAAATEQATYNGVLKAIGGTGNAQFALYSSQDTKGTAASQTDTRATVNGQLVYTAIDSVAHGDTAGLAADITLQANRALLAALQASNLPADVAKIIDSLVPATATSDQITQVLSLATAYGTLQAQIKAVDPSNIQKTIDALTAPTALDAFRTQGNALDDLVANFDGSAASTQALTAATGTYYQSLVQLLSQIKQITAQVDSTYASASEQINLAGRDNTFLGNYYKSDAQKQTDLIGTETDPTKIQTEANAATSDALKAFNLLSPADQAAQRQTFQDAVKTINETADARLTEISTTATAAFKSDLDGVKEALNGVVDKMTVNTNKDANTATVNSAAANTQLVAARTPIQVVVTQPTASESNG